MTHQTKCAGGLGCSVTTHSRVTVPPSVTLTRSGARISVLVLVYSELARSVRSARAGTRSSPSTALGSLVTRLTRTDWTNHKSVSWIEQIRGQYLPGLASC